MNRKNRNTSWQKVGKWYNELVDQKGHFYHQTVVIPGVLKLLNLKSGDSLLDLACGQGVLSRNIPNEVHYVGIDSASYLISQAQKLNKKHNHQYSVGDVTKPLNIPKNFSCATLILALQNIEFPEKTIQNASAHLKSYGRLVIVLNHPCFRIPRQSSWETDPINKLQYRKINRYMSPLKIPITMRPGVAHSPITWSFHYPLSFYSEILHTNGFIIEKLEEWTSRKTSVGKAARRENRARDEFPLFLALLVRKTT